MIEQDAIIVFDDVAETPAEKAWLDSLVKNKAKFDFGVAMLPANKRRGTPTGDRIVNGKSRVGHRADLFPAADRMNLLVIQARMHYLYTVKSKMPI